MLCYDSPRVAVLFNNEMKIKDKKQGKKIGISFFLCMCKMFTQKLQLVMRCGVVSTIKFVDLCMCRCLLQLSILIWFCCIQERKIRFCGMCCLLFIYLANVADLRIIILFSLNIELRVHQLCLYSQFVPYFELN